MPLAEQASESLRTESHDWQVMSVIDVPGYNVDTEAAVWTLRAIQATDVRPPIAPVILHLKHQLPPHPLLNVISPDNNRPAGTAHQTRGNTSIATIACKAAKVEHEPWLQRVAVHELQHIADFSSPKWVAEQEHYIATKADRCRKFWDALSMPADFIVKVLSKGIDGFELDPELTVANYTQAVNITRKSPWERRAQKAAKRSSQYPKIIYVNQTKYEQQ